MTGGAICRGNEELLANSKKVDRRQILGGGGGLCVLTFTDYVLIMPIGGIGLIQIINTG